MSNCEPMRVLVKRAPGRAGRLFDVVLPAGSSILGGTQRASYLHVDFLPPWAPKPEDAGKVDRYRGQVGRALAPGAKREPLEFETAAAYSLGDGEYLFVGAPVREVAKS